MGKEMGNCKERCISVPPDQQYMLARFLFFLRIDLKEARNM